MKTLYLIFILFIGQFAFSQSKSENKTLKSFIDPIITKTEVLKNADHINIVVDGNVIKNPEKYEFDILSMKEIKVSKDKKQQENTNHYSYTISITTTR